MNHPTLTKALTIIRSTPGYEGIGADLIHLISKNRLRVNPALPDRAQAGIFGTIILGPEAVASSPLSLAQTLVHEQFHLHQNLLLKTVSFWAGILTRTPVMKRYEEPAYQAAIDFMEAVKLAHPALKSEVAREQFAVKQVFTLSYGGVLR